MTKFRIASALAVTSLVLAACSGGSQSALPSATLSNNVRTPASNGVGNGVQAPVASPTSLKFTALGSANAQTFTVTVQFAGDLIAASSNSGVATVGPSSVSPTVTPNGGGTKSGTFTVTPTGAGTATITVTDKKGGTTTVSVTVTLAAKHLFTASQAGADRSFSVFDPLASGNVAPLYTISSATSAVVSNPAEIRTGPDGNIWELNGGINGVFVFAADAQGASTPIAQIWGSSTLLQGGMAMTFDGAGKIYVLSQGMGQRPTVLEYAAGSNGDVAPLGIVPGAASNGAVGPDQFFAPTDIAALADGTLYVSNNSANYTSFGPQYGDVLAFAPGANGASAAPEATITGAEVGNPVGVDVDANGRIYVLTNDNYDYAIGQNSWSMPPNDINPRIVVYAAGASGNAAPIAVISGSATQLHNPVKMRVDKSGGIYVADESSVYYYAPGSNGNVAPARVISGSNTGFDGSNGGFSGGRGVAVVGL